MQAVRFYQRPVIPLTVALMAGIALGGVAPGYSSWALVLTLACGLGTAHCRVRRQPAAISPLVLFVSLGYLSLQVWVDPRFPENHVSRFVDSGPWRIIGVVDARPLEFESRTQFVLRTAHLQSGSDIQAVSGLLRVTAIGETLALQQGDRVALHGRIRSIRNFNNPGGFDFKRSMAYREIWAGATVAGTELVLIEKEADHGLFGAIDRMRSGIAGLIDQAGLGPEAAVLKALVDRKSRPHRQGFYAGTSQRLREFSRKRGRITDRGATVFFKQPRQAAGVVAVKMGKKNHLDFVGGDPQPPHVSQQRRAAAAGIEENGVRGACDQTGKPPFGGYAWHTPVVVAHHGDAQGLDWNLHVPGHLGCRVLFRVLITFSKISPRRR